MTGPNNNYERALVPEHLTKQTIETVPLDVAFYIAPGEHEDYTGPTIFVAPDDRLVMSKTEAIEADDAYPESPLERVGVMHIAVLESDTIRDTYIADLRFLDENALVKVDPKIMSSAEQEEWAEMLDVLEDTVTFEAFIAPEPHAEVDDGVVPGTFYGNPELYRTLEVFAKQGDERLKAYLDREAGKGKKSRNESEPKAAEPATEPEAAEKPAAEEAKKQPAYLDAPFSNQR